MQANTHPKDLKERQSATSTAITHLEGLLFSGNLQPGDVLPSESKLSASLGISRLTLREALRALEARGLIHVSHGRPPTIAPPNSAPIKDYFVAAVRRDPGNLLELVELRLAIETHSAGLAARQATKGDLAALEMALEAMRRSTDDLDRFNLADVRFHEAVSMSSGNRMLSFLVEAMDEPFRESRAKSLEGYLRTHTDLDVLVKDHERIYERIAGRDPEGAVQAMRDHLTETRNDLRAALSLRPRSRG